ncbi:histidine-rich glycoprotein [Varanus komodoensis]|uniref:histidine-rich glycoprotein n=1 Tax=Varanus komodoensis TaxID=61221 RepID=UPI001CF7E949|nr:histidine-rich glycoprotein [Varanus komodoensis]
MSVPRTVQMELVSAVVFITVLLCSALQSQSSVTSADCNDVEIEKDAEFALDLINKHRSDGYIFSLLRVGNAYTERVHNTSIEYLTLDVLETECPVLSRKHWSTCGHRQFYPSTDFGQCKTVMSLDHFQNRKKLHGYNCTMSPVPPHLYPCKDCPVKVTVLQDTEEFAEAAKRILGKYKQESNETRNFMVEKVQKVFSAVASRTVYIIEFTIKEAVCPSSVSPAHESECGPCRRAHMGFCRGKVLKEAKDPDGVEVESCEIYNIHYGRGPFHHHHHFHHDSGEHHHHCNMSHHECRFPPAGPSWHHYRHHHRHHHYGCGHYHRYRHGLRYRYPPPPDNHRDGLAGPVGHHNSSEQDEEGDPDLVPPPGPQYPPPPPGGPHHLPPSRYPSPPVGPPPHGPHGHPPPKFHRNGHHRGHHRGHHHHWCHNTTKGREGDSSEQPDSFREHDSFCHNKVGMIYHIPVLSENDILQAPEANFLNHPAISHGKLNESLFPDTQVHKKSVIQPFPEVPSESKSCPGKPKSELPQGILSLYPS